MPDNQLENEFENRELQNLFSIGRKLARFKDRNPSGVAVLAEIASYMLFEAEKEEEERKQRGNVVELFPSGGRQSAFKYQA